jgi:hypothetical protein
MRCAMCNATALELRPSRRERWITGVGWATAALVLLLGAAAQAQTARDIIAAADKVRNPGVPFRLTSTLTEYVSGKPRDQDTLIVFAKEDPATGQFRNLVQYIDPPRDAGKMALLDSHALWFYDPASKASVRISPQQRLIGQASIGDILTINLAVDYTGTIVGSETIQDTAHQEHSCWHVDMKAANDLATYNRVEYWVETGSFHPIKAKFYSDSGRLLKILYYRGFAQALGATRPTEAIIIDAVDSNLITTAKFTDYQLQDIPEAWFQREYLPRLKVE